ncbi:TetR family transcriptional regulator [Antrihabitans stalactiti]|uniref:TetR family transcriptional regulator n=1 Tax=Antrihabitans stalactiti TaxID=2584121 RepID=A0A848KG81_9NOCA|nr:TetR family transcriptional regulator [Antrihabitans stalactiti]
MTETESSSHAGPWERKKRQAMRHIQGVAFDLFDELGYRAVAVDRVAATAGVSPSSIYRYFGTKEMLVLYDEFDQQLLELLERAGGGDLMRPLDLLEAARAAVPTLLDVVLSGGGENQFKRRMRYVLTEPDVKAGLTRQTEDLEASIRAVAARRSGTDPDDLTIRIATTSAAWAFNAAMDYWARSNFAEPLREVLRRATGIIIDGAEVQLAGLQLKTTSQTAM